MHVPYFIHVYDKNNNMYYIYNVHTVKYKIKIIKYSMLSNLIRYHVFFFKQYKVCPKPCA